MWEEWLRMDTGERRGGGGYDHLHDHPRTGMTFKASTSYVAYKWVHLSGRKAPKAQGWLGSARELLACTRSSGGHKDAINHTPLCNNTHAHTCVWMEVCAYAMLFSARRARARTHDIAYYFQHCATLCLGLQHVVWGLRSVPTPRVQGVIL